MSQYRLVWQDEFDAPVIDPRKWNYRAEGTVRALATVSRDTISLDGQGHLAISVIKGPDGKYYVGQLGTEGLFETTYGYFECRAKMNSEVGPHVAFWLQSPDMSQGGDPAENGAEIDIFEYHRRTPGKIYHTVHWGGYGEGHKQEGTEISVPSIDTGFHTFGLEWTPAEYIFYIDGRETWRTATAVSHRPQYLILSTELTGWGGDPSQSSFPDAVIFDYVRVYKRQEIDSFHLIKNEFIFEKAPFASCHASTIVETADGLLAAWFGGTVEGAADVGIWASRFDGQKWSDPREIANGISEDGGRYACWNPVLFRRRNGELLLFYKIGPSPASWWGMLKISKDEGRTWSQAHRLPEGILGPIKNKPVELDDGTILCGSSEEAGGWRVHLEWTKEPLARWERGPDLNQPPDIEAIQPAILRHPGGRFQILCRSRQGRLMESWSRAGDPTEWTPLQQVNLPNPNSGIDAVTLADGRHLLVYNPIKQGRHILALAISLEGQKWQQLLELENEPGSEFSYPAVIQTGDGLIHLTYTWKRQRIKHLVFSISG
ncbi:MAG: exo-alpha-sialidase [Candidatus Saccharicenans sp.]